MTDLILFSQQDAAGGLVGGVLSMMLVFWILAIAASVFWIWMLIDALMNERTTNDKILWFLVIFFLHFIGAIIYFAVRRSGRSRVLT